MRLHAGTSGFSYKEWKGLFYPEDLPTARWLEFYAGKLTGVEINNTFYRMPKKEVVQAWAEQVPEGFAFVLKASRRITHFKRLRDAGDETAFMLGQFAAMGERLGAVLIQLPPNMKKDVERLAGFLDQLPPGTRAAFEFRNETWDDDEVKDLLRARNLALVIADDDEGVEPALEPTADWGYLRLRHADYGPDQLDAWVRKIRSQPWKDAFVFFKHEDEGAGPRMAGDFLARFEASGDPG